MEINERTIRHIFFTSFRNRNAFIFNANLNKSTVFPLELHAMDQIQHNRYGFSGAINRLLFLCMIHWGLLLSFEIMLYHSQSQSHIWLQDSDYILSSDSIISAHSFSCEAEIRKKVIIYTCRHWNQVCSFAFPWSPFQVLLEKFSSVTSTMYINFVFFFQFKNNFWSNTVQWTANSLDLGIFNYK